MKPRRDLSGTAAAGAPEAPPSHQPGSFGRKAAGLTLRAGGFLLKTAALVIVVGLLMPAAIHIGQVLFAGACINLVRSAQVFDER